MATNRLVIVSHRLPVTASADGDVVRLAPANGGLAPGLLPWHERSGGAWIGWPGDVSSLTAGQRTELDRQLAERAIVPVHLSPDQVDRYYHGFANGVLWPLFHYLIDRVPVEATGWDAYKEVNEIIADAVMRLYRPEDTIWIHDYHLMLVPALLRQRLPHARIGFFLHIPFPSSEVFRILPWRREILNGLLGADLVGFNTFAYLRHFMASLLHVNGVEAHIDRVRATDREIRLGVYPIGVDAKGLAALAETPEVVTRTADIRRDAGGRRIVLGVDRLDYAKGIPRRLQAVGRLLEREPLLRDAIRFVQVAVPALEGVDSYQRFRRQVEEAVGRINGACGTLSSTPVHYIHRPVSMSELVALYSAADVMLVTPLRDGMNLVAKEFVASRGDGDGALVLSEFAGAASELAGAVVVNPYDVEGVADALRTALAMPAGERRARMRDLRRRVFDYSIHTWAEAFITQLEAVVPSRLPMTIVRPQPGLSTVIAEAKRSPRLHVLLDYDGTAVPLARSPGLAAPDQELLSLLEAVAASPGIELQLVSGRPRDTLDAWFRHSAMALWAEHGCWHRPDRDSDWQPTATITPDWMILVRPILEQFTATTPGSLIEIKSASMAWHYRGAPREFGARQAHELRMLLGDALSNQPLEVLEGKKFIEVRLRGVSKATVAHRLQQEPGTAAAIIAFGDDRTDEELFGALPPSSVTVAVGGPLSGAKYCVSDYRAVRQVLRSLLPESRLPDAPAGAA